MTARHKAARIAAFGLAPLALTVFVGGSAQGHGFSTAPTSRQAHCADGTAKNCGNIQYEPQSVEGPKGFPAAGPKDGSICSAGKESFKQLDDPRGGKWPTTKVQAGAAYNFKWTLKAMHATTDFSFYVTKDGWDPSKPITRDQLEKKPFFTKKMNHQQPPAQWTAQGKMPAGKKGKHVILGVWTIADTANAFYSCSDVTFGGSAGNGSTTGGGEATQAPPAPAEQPVQEGTAKSADTHHHGAHSHGGSTGGDSGGDVTTGKSADNGPAPQGGAEKPDHLAQTGGDDNTATLAMGGAATLAVGAGVVFATVRRRAARQRG